MLAVNRLPRPVLLAVAGGLGATVLAGLDYRVAAVLTTAMVIAGWIWNPIQGPRPERFGAVLVTQIALLVPVAFAARWLSWHLIWSLIVLLMSLVAIAGVVRGRPDPALANKTTNPIDSWRLTSALQVAVVLLPTLVVALPFMTRDSGGHLWLFSRGFDNTAHFNVMSAVAKTGAWPWGERYADVSGQLIFSPALPQQVWALIARALALGGLPSGGVLVLAFSIGQILAYGFLTYGVLLMTRRVASLAVLASAKKWVWAFALATLVILLSVGSSITLVLNGFANYAWAIAGLAFCLTGAMLLQSRNFSLSLTLVLAGGLVATMSYAPLVIASVVIAALVAWQIRSTGMAGSALSGALAATVITVSALVVGLLTLSVVRSALPAEAGLNFLPTVYFFPLEALAVTGGIKTIPWFAMVLLVAGAITFLLVALKPRPSFESRIAFATLATVALLTLAIGVYSLAQTGQLSYYTIKLQYSVFVLVLPFFIGVLVLMFTKWQPKPLLGTVGAIVILLVTSQSFGYSLPVGQTAFLKTELPPRYISPGLAWLQLANDPAEFPGFPGEVVADLGNRKADGVVVLFNPPKLDLTQERGAQVYPNSMRYTGDTWVWSLADTWLGTDWGDESLEQLWNWRWSNQRRPVTIYTFSTNDLQRVQARLPEFITPEVSSGLYQCTQDRSCVTEVVKVTLGAGN